MLKFIFDLLTEPLGLPIEWYYEWVILAVIGLIAYIGAYMFVGDMYHLELISGKNSGSFLHWIIRLFLFITLWGITYGVIWVVKYHITQLVLLISSVSIVLGVYIIIRFVRRNNIIRIR